METGRQGEAGKLFYIIPRHNRANLSEHTHVHMEDEREAKLHHSMCFFKGQIGNVLGISLNIDCVEKAPAGFRFTFSAFSAMSSNYNNELGGAMGPRHPVKLA